MAKKKIVALGGDGVGPEVVSATCYILENAGFELDIEKPPHAEEALKKYNNPFPDETKKLCDESDAILFGATQTASRPILTYLRWACDNYVNIRPMKYYQGAISPLKDPSSIDFVILRENSEGLYPGREGDLSMLAESMPDYRDGRIGKAFADYGEGKFAIRIVSEKGMKRFANYSCEYTLKRKKIGHKGKLTCVTKSNVLRESDGLFQRIMEEEINKYPNLSYEHYYIDDMARRVLRYPKEFDVIVTSNLFGDILSDECAELVGGLGLAGSGCTGGKIAYFEPTHGSAPKYAGKNVINPTATILSAKLMLDYLGMHEEATSLESAVENLYKKGRSLTYDQGGSTSTIDFAKAILMEIH